MELLFTTTLLPSVLFPCRLNALAQEHLIDLLHLGALIVLERREVIIVLISVVFLSSVVNAEAELDHAVDAAAKVTGSSRVKPDVSKEVSNSSQIRSLTVLSFLSSSARARRASMMGCNGFTSIVFFDAM